MSFLLIKDCRELIRDNNILVEPWNRYSFFGGDIRETMLNRNEDFAEKQVDAFNVMRITESVPLDHEEAYSVSRRQSQMRYCTLLHPARCGLNCAFPPLMPHGFPVKFHAKYNLRHRARCITPYRYSCVLRRCAFLLALGLRKARAKIARKFLIIIRCTKQTPQMQILSQLFLDTNPLLLLCNY